MDKPLVSICIPTYNRCEQLKVTLDSVVSQPEFIDGRVEVVINDNASDDKTYDLGSEYSSKYENVHYYRNTENIRDRNFPLVLSRVNGVLRKLNNDTFLISKNVLKKLCDVAANYKDTKPQIFLLIIEKNLAMIKKRHFMIS